MSKQNQIDLSERFETIIAGKLVPCPLSEMTGAEVVAALTWSYQQIDRLEAAADAVIAASAPIDALDNDLLVGTPADTDREVALVSATTAVLKIAGEISGRYIEAGQKHRRLLDAAMACIKATRKERETVPFYELVRRYWPSPVASGLRQ
jgi:hypothetical protein